MVIRSRTDYALRRAASARAIRSPRVTVFLQQLTAQVLWRMIDGEISAWSRAGHKPRIWWRDDDARHPSASLDRLLRLSETSSAPLALAVIPDTDLSDLASAIAGRPLVRAIQHGCDHVDRNQGGGFSSEFPPACPSQAIASAINAAWSRLSQAMDAAPIYAAPWNVLLDNARTALAETPIRGVSLYGARGASTDGLVDINTHIDIMRWRPARFRGTNPILQRLLRLLRARRKERLWTEPIGLLTHHRNLDAEAWAFLESFLERVAPADKRLLWASVTELLGST